MTIELICDSTTAAAPEPAALSSEASPPNLAAAGLGLLSVATLAGCFGLGGGGGGGGGSDNQDSTTIKITGFSVREASNAPLTVDGHSANDQVFPLPEAAGNGSEQRLPFVVRPVAGSLRAVGGPTLLTIALNPDPAQVLADFPTQVATARTTLAQLGFPPSWDELAAQLQVAPATIIARALARMSATPEEDYPSWIDGQLKSWNELKLLTEDERKAYQDRKYPRRQELKAWWFKQMVQSSDPLTERLLLFWHNLYTTSGNSVEDPELMARQHRLYRTHLTGNLRTFLYAMTRDPAMCQYLDSARNNKDAPNENFARELMELFTLGERNQYGGYAESDVADLAKFFTGYHLDGHQAFTFNVNQHVTAAKTLFGQVRETAPVTGYTADGDWAIDRILNKVDGGNHSYAARYLVTRLWREFLGAPIGSDATRIQEIADLLSGSFAWDLKKLYAEFFASAAFTETARRGTRVRAPVELFVGFYRPLGLQPEKWDGQLWVCYVLDQDLLDPPNVFGWPGGLSWINLKTVVDRRLFVSWLQWADPVKNLPLRLHGVIQPLLLAIPPVDAPLLASDWRNNYIHTRIGHLLTDPVYNVG